MNPRFSITATLLAGALSAPMTGCSKDLPTQPDRSPGAAATVPSLSPAITAANDDFDGATVITSLPFTDAVNTSDATTAGDDPEDCVGTGPTVWYRFTPSESSRITVNTSGSNYDTGLSAYTGARGALVLVGCNDDAGGTVQSRLTVEAVAGQTLFFMVGAFASGPGGDLVFHADVAPPPLEGEMTIDRYGSLDASTGIAIVRGTVTCSRPAFASLDGVLRARIGRLLVEAPFFSSGECDDGGTVWMAEVAPQNALLVGGRVEVQVFGFVFDPITEDFAPVQGSATVLLRGKS